MILDAAWFSVGFAALALLQIAALAQQRNAREDRRLVMEKLDNLVDKVGAQNGRVGKLETWRDEHVKFSAQRDVRLDATDKELARRLEDTWTGHDRRRPRGPK